MLNFVILNLFLAVQKVLLTRYIMKPNAWSLSKNGTKFVCGTQHLNSTEIVI